MEQNSIFDSVMESRYHFKNEMNTKGKASRLYAIAWFLSMMAVCIIQPGCINTNQKKSSSGQDIPVFDLTKNYPEIELEADEAEKDCIPLETTDNVLAAADFLLEYISDQCIIGRNRIRGDVFIFNKNGKIVSFFNHTGQGPNEYTSIRSLVFDGITQEIFISDFISKNRCLVYSTDGKYLRQFNYPENSRIGNLYDFDEQTLLAYNDLSPAQDGALEINQITPYVFLSKKDGSLISRLDLSFPNRLADTYMRKMGEIAVGLPLRFGGNLKCGNEFFIVNRSSDTLFLLTQDKKLTPLFVRTPSVYDENQVISIVISFKTHMYLVFETLSFNFDEATKQILNRQPFVPPSRIFAYNIQTHKLFNIIKGNTGQKVDVLGKSEVMLHRSDLLVDRLEKGELDGKLKQIAQNINAEDNPIVEIIRYK